MQRQTKGHSVFQRLTEAFVSSTRTEPDGSDWINYWLGRYHSWLFQINQILSHNKDWMHVVSSALYLLPRPYTLTNCCSSIFWWYLSTSIMVNILLAVPFSFSSMVFTSVLCLSTWPKYFTCLCFISFSSSLLICSLSKASVFDWFCFHEIQHILLYIHITRASIWYFNWLHCSGFCTTL